MIVSPKKVSIILYSICEFFVGSSPFDVNNSFRVTGGELFEDIVAREFYSEADAR